MLTAYNRRSSVGSLAEELSQLALEQRRVKSFVVDQLRLPAGVVAELCRSHIPETKRYTRVKVEDSVIGSLLGLKCKMCTSIKNNAFINWFTYIYSIQYTVYKKLIVQTLLY